MIGTDHPYDMGDTTPLAHLREATDEETFQLIAEANPWRLFGLGIAGRLGMTVRRGGWTAAAPIPCLQQKTAM